MKRVLTAVLILALAVAMTACSTDEHKALEKDRIDQQKRSGSSCFGAGTGRRRAGGGTSLTDGYRWNLVFSHLSERGGMKSS